MKKDLAYFESFVKDLGIELDRTNPEAVKVIYRGTPIMAFSEKIPVEDAIREIKLFFDNHLNELNLLKLKLQTGRPISVPEHITIKEYNFILDYLKAQRVNFINCKVVTDKPLEEPKILSLNG
jgi:hypothetical protein